MISASTQVGTETFREVDAHEIWRDILAQAASVTEASSASLFLIDEREGALEMVLSVGATEDTERRGRLAAGAGVSTWVARTGKAAIVPDVTRDLRCADGGAGSRSELAVPVTRDGRILGVITVGSDRPDAFPAETTELMEMFARRCADALGYAAAADETRRLRDQLTGIVEIGRELGATDDLEEVLGRIVRNARRLIDGKLASLMLERSGRWETVATDGAGPAYLDRPPPDPRSSVAGRVLQTGQPVTVADLRAEPAFQLTDVAERENLRSMLSVPLRSRERIMGVLNVYSAACRKFGTHEIALMTLLAQQSTTAIESASLYEQAREAGEHLRASEKLAALGRLSAGLAHEIRNPLNTLSVLTYAMAEQADSCGYSRDDLDVLRSEVRRMSLLVDQFLDFARPRSPSFQRQHVEEIVEETLLLVGPEARKKGIVIERALEERTPATWADGDQLKQVFLNIILNAMQSMPGGGKLSLAVRRSGGGVVTEVRDTGSGIDPEVRDHLFEPFVTTRAGGTGLGLPIAMRIVDGHSGSLSIDSQPGVGTTVSVWLPL